MNANLSTTNPKPIPTSPVKVNWWVDLALFAAIMLSLAPHTTGMTIHEWLGIGLGAAIVVHLLLHWQWIVTVLKRVFSRTPLATRINLFLNIALFINMVIIIFTGLLISQEALPLFGITISADHQWESIHKLSADTIVWISGLHVALHWKWILTAIKRYLINPFVKLGQRQPQPKPSYEPVEVKQ